MNHMRRTRLLRELVDIKERLRTHGIQVAYNKTSRSLKEHIADIKRRDEIEAILEGR